MTENTLKFLARRYMRLAGSEEAVRWALAELVAGTDSKSLIVLAGLEAPFDSFEVDSLVRRSLEELNWQTPDRQKCLREYAALIARAIVTGSMGPLDGGSELYQIYTTIDHSSDLQPWLYLMDGLEPRTYRSLEGAELEAAIKREASTFLERL